jgi:prephenate dehydrogenase
MIKMSCEQHDKYTAKSQFVTHVTSRIIEEQSLVPTPIDTKGFETLLTLSKNTCKDSFELFYGLYFYNKYAMKQLDMYKDALCAIEKRLSEYPKKSK